MNFYLLKVGDRVRRRHVWDGSSNAGAPIGPALMIVKVYPGEAFTIYQLLDGRTEFEFNRYPEPLETQWAHESKPTQIAS